LPHLRYPPAGDRGVAFGVRRHGFAPGDAATLERANAEVVGIVQVESEAAVAEAGAIAAVPGVDVLFVGPSDLSQSMGILGQTEHRRFRAAVDAVVDAAQGARRALGVFVATPDGIDPWLERGFTLIAIGSDTGFLAASARRTAELARTRVAGSR
jgi:2-keto-3-deoxy-L-rhamnonate aldolase RhmA